MLTAQNIYYENYKHNNRKFFTVPSRKKFRTTYSVGGLVNFPQFQQNFIDLYCFAHF